MRMVGRIQNSAVLERWKGIDPDVILTEERIAHIRAGHAADYDAYNVYIPDAIENPDCVLEDIKNEDTAMFVKRVDHSGINVIVRLAYRNNGQGKTSSILTMYCIGEKRLRRLLRQNPVLYNSVEICYNSIAEGRSK